MHKLLGQNTTLKYTITTKYQKCKKEWILRIEDNKGKWEEKTFSSEADADKEGKNIAKQITKGAFVLM